MPIDRLTAGDELMLRASSRWPQHVAAVAILDGTDLFDHDGALRIEAVRAAIGSRLSLVPRLRQRLVEPRRGLGAPFWVDVPIVDLAWHVRAWPVAAPGGEPELTAAVEAVRRLPLEPDRPLWAIWLLTGLSGRRVGLFVALHHAIADGRAATTLLGAFLEPLGRPETVERAVERPPDAPSPSPPPTSAALLADSVRRQASGFVGLARRMFHLRATLAEIRRALPATRELLAERPATRTNLDRMVGAERSIAVARASAADVGRIGRAHVATANDVLLALTAGGIRATLISRGERVAGVTAKVYVPVSLRRGRERKVRGDRGNRITQMAVPISLGETDPSRRLRAIARETGRRKRRYRPSLGTWFRGGLLTRLLLGVVVRQRVNTTTALLRGPDRPVALAGSPLLELFPVLPLIGNVTLGAGVVTYAGRFDIAITADRATYPDLGPFVAAVRADLAALEAAADEFEDGPRSILAKEVA